MPEASRFLMRLFFIKAYSRMPPLMSKVSSKKNALIKKKNVFSGSSPSSVIILGSVLNPAKNNTADTANIGKEVKAVTTQLILMRILPYIS